MTTPLDAIRAVDFDWALRMAEVWTDYWDDPALHASTRRKFDDKLTALSNRTRSSTMGWMITGTAGSGKTHLMGAFRHTCWNRDAAFILVDMTGVVDFWSTLLQSMLDSLQQQCEPTSSQYQKVLANVARRFGAKDPLAKFVKLLAKRKSTDLKSDIHKMLVRLSAIDKAQASRYQDAVRALLCWNSEDFGISNIGLGWLQGQSLSPEEATDFGFIALQEQPIKIVESLSWLLSLSGPTVIAFDQIDTLVRQYEVARHSRPDSDTASQAWAIIQNVGEGLGTLRDHTFWSMPVVACLESTRPILKETIPVAYLDRFDADPEPLSALDAATIGQSIVRQRLHDGFKQCGYEPPYPTWPFKPQAFATAGRLTPRELLKHCHQKRNEWVASGVITEVQAFDSTRSVEATPAPTNTFKALDDRFQDLRAAANVSLLTAEKDSEAAMPAVLGAVLQCLVAERAFPSATRATILTEFTGATTTRPLHARVSLADESNEDDELIHCFRAIQHANARAFQARLGAAMTESGIDRNLPFRTLTVIRTTPRPTGAATEKLISRLAEAGGIWFEPTDDELRTALALHALKKEAPADLEQWLLERKPATTLRLFGRLLAAAGNGASPPKPGPSTAPPRNTATVIPTASPTPPAALDPVRIRVGSSDDASATPINVSVDQLCKHTLVVAGSGSGKTVLLKRLIEESGLRNIPAIVIDCIGNLTQLGQPWTTPPATWGPQDPTLAQQFRTSVDVAVWTPGMESGNPLSLELIPDFTSVAASPDDLEIAVMMVHNMLAPIVAPGKSQAAGNKRGVLTKSLRSFLRTSSSLPRFIDYLRNLPDEARVGVAREDKLASDMADALASQREQNPLLRSEGEPLDPSRLLVDEAGRPRVSVIGFSGLPPEAQHMFVGQLAATLFAWLKRQPKPQNRPLHGLLVVDEAREFVPGNKSTACKEGLMRLAAQARNYKFGLIFATQNPKDLETKIVSQCSTHFYGKMSSPATIAAAQELLREKGRSVDDIARLGSGRFYVHNADEIQRPTRVHTPMCLSRHE